MVADYIGSQLAATQSTIQLQKSRWLLHQQQRDPDNSNALLSSNTGLDFRSVELIAPVKPLSSPIFLLDVTPPILTF